jgi:MinD-like ATPase involved in chromosome partitioning or flagellar assembly
MAPPRDTTLRDGGLGRRLRSVPRLGDAVRMPVQARRRRGSDLVSRVRAPMTAGQYGIVVMSLKGGVGKTTVTVGLGSALASLRGDPVIAVDASPDRGTLSDKVTLETPATIRDLLAERDQIRGYADVRAFTSRSSSGLEILAAEQDPTASEPLGAQDYALAREILADFYPVILTDCGTGLPHPAMAEVLRHADQVVLASTPAVDSARSADAALDLLIARGYRDLASNSLLVFSAVRPRSRSTVSLKLLDEHFSARCRAVARVPYDARLDEGAEVEIDQLGRRTADAFREIAAMVADGFGTDPPAARRDGTATWAGLRQAGPRTRADAW